MSDTNGRHLKQMVTVAGTSIAAILAWYYMKKRIEKSAEEREHTHADEGAGGVSSVRAEPHEGKRWEDHPFAYEKKRHNMKAVIRESQARARRMIDQTREVRIFVSSTFRDYFVEREHIVKQKCSHLRNLCASRGVTLTEIDLRTGVTKEQTDDNQTIIICLLEIDRCSYQFSMLGQRYGWAHPSTGPYQDLTASQDAAVKLPQLRWIDGYRDRSVTELEIRYGVLNRPVPLCCFFALRNPGYLPAEAGADWSESDTGLAAKLKNLRETIVCSGFPVCDNYEAPIDCAKFFEIQMLAALRRDLPPELPNRFERLRRANADQGALACRCFIGGDDIMTSMQQILSRVSSGATTIVLRGERGCGLSALMGYWVSKMSKVFTDMASETVGDQEADRAAPISFYASAAPECSNKMSFVHLLTQELKRRCGICKDEPTDEKGASALSALLKVWLKLAVDSLKENHVLGEEQPLIVTFDGIDHLEGSSTDKELVWLPDAPKNTLFVVSAHTGSQALKALERVSATSTSRSVRGGSLHQHGASSGCQELRNLAGDLSAEIHGTEDSHRIVFVNVGEFSHGRRGEIAAQFFVRYNKTLSLTNLEKLKNGRLCGNGLCLTLILNEIRMFGTFEQVNDHVDSLLSSTSVPELLSSIFDRLTLDFASHEGGKGLIAAILSSLWPSRRGLAENEAKSIVGQLMVSKGLIEQDPVTKEVDPVTKEVNVVARTFTAAMQAMTDIITQRQGVLQYATAYTNDTIRAKYLIGIQESPRAAQIKSPMSPADKRRLQEFEPWRQELLTLRFKESKLLETEVEFFQLDGTDAARAAFELPFLLDRLIEEAISPRTHVQSLLKCLQSPQVFATLYDGGEKYALKRLWDRVSSALPDNPNATPGTSYRAEALKFEACPERTRQECVLIGHIGKFLTFEVSGSAAAAWDVLQHAVLLDEASAEVGPSDSLVAQHLENIAQLLQRYGYTPPGWDEATKKKEQALILGRASEILRQERIDRMRSPLPSPATGSHMALSADVLIASAYLDLMGRPSCAEPQDYDESILDKLTQAWNLASSAGDMTRQATALNAVGTLHIRRGLLKDAEARFQEALDLRNKCLTKDDADVGQVLISLGETYLQMGVKAIADGDDARGKVQYGLSFDYYARGFEVYQSAIGGDHHRCGHAYHGMAMAKKGQGEIDEARKFAAEAVRVRRHGAPPKFLAASEVLLEELEKMLSST